MATSKKSSELSEVELRPDGWERFDRAVTAAAKSGPKHRQSDKWRKKRSPKIKMAPRK
jgi:hypothetical protein